MFVKIGDDIINLDCVERIGSHSVDASGSYEPLAVVMASGYADPIKEYTPIDLIDLSVLNIMDFDKAVADRDRRIAEDQKARGMTRDQFRQTSP